MARWLATPARTRAHRQVASRPVAKVASPAQSPATRSALRPLARGVVALVGAIPITKQALEHWTEVEAIEELPRPARLTRPLPAPERASLQQKALQMLIARYWVGEEAARASVALTGGEVERMLRLRFPGKGALQRFLVRTGLRASDERFLMENLLLPEKWHRAVLPAYARLRRNGGHESIREANEIDVEVGNLSESLTRRWTPRTHCHAGYVVMFCSEYRE
jgi:hypothetical protein